MDKKVEIAEKKVHEANKGREKFMIEKIGGYCPYVDLNSDFCLILAVYQRDLAGVTDSINKHPFYRLGYTTKGKVIINDMKSDYMVTGGTFYAFKPGESSFTRCLGSAEWSHYTLNFSGIEAGRLLEETGIFEHRVVNIRDQNAADDILRTMVEEIIKNGKNSKQICEYYLKILLLNLSDWFIDLKKIKQTDYQTFTKCKNIFDKEFVKLVSIDEIAIKCGLSQQHLSRIFKKYIDTTPLNYLIKLKMNRAAVLLLGTDFTISQIAQSLSYNDQFYFSKVFKKIYGVSPLEYRKSIRNKIKSTSEQKK